MKEVNTDKKYFGKVLLFGEHNVLYGGHGFALPLPQFFGKWAYDTKKSALPETLHDYLEEQKFLGATFLSEFFRHQHQNGLCFESNIKSGYGTGSSGAISAAIYDTFFSKEIVKLEETKQNLATVERFFQGTSSGIDPTVIYLNNAVSISEEHTQVEENHHYKKLNSPFYLLDSQQKRSTLQMIDLFRKAISYDKGAQLLKQLIDHSNQCIKLITKDLDQATFDYHMKSISEIQLTLASELIPQHIKKYWSHGLEHDQYYMKLCGAGGGGYFLLYGAKNIGLHQIPQQLLVSIG